MARRERTAGRHGLAAIVFLLMASTGAGAQSGTPNTSVAVRELAPAELRSAVPFGAIVGVRPISNGTVLVNDGGNRQLVLLDAMWSAKTVVIDSATPDGQGYGPLPTPFVPYLGDTTLFFDRKSETISVIGPAGEMVRILAAPKPTDFRFLSAFSGGVDGKGNLIYRGEQPRDANAPPVPFFVASLQPPDSAPIVRANFESRSVDTLARIKVAGNVRARMDTVGSQTVYTVTVNPLLVVDEWAMLSDGTLAMVRGHDYHVDVVASNGTRVAGPKLPFDWKSVTDAEKQHLIDSTLAAQEKEKAATPDATALPNAVGVARVRVRSGVGLSIARKVADRREIPDYWPPIRYGATKADADGNLWILPTTSAQSKAGELVYDVVNNRGEMMHRVRLPAGRSIAGFGRGGVVYLMQRDNSGAWFLERTRVVP